ncbi:MAG: ABC transporter permease subunit [Holosporales bacterium]|jgi:putrescine transport system permease protein|nr:ABC transporter permease subunit [Holosporales bacterium]
MNAKQISYGILLIWKAVKRTSLFKSLKDPQFFFGLLPLLWLIVFFLAPILVIIVISFASTSFSIPPFSEVFKWSIDNILEITLNTQNYISVVKDSYYIHAFFNSIVLSIITTAVCSVLGFAMAYGIFCARKERRANLLVLVTLSFWTSFLIRVYAWINMLSAHGMINRFLMKIGLTSEPIQFTGNYYAVCLGLIFCYLPFMILPIYAVLEKIDRSCVESSWDLGCKVTRTFWRLTVPLSKDGLKNGCILVSTASLAEFVVPELVGGASTITFGRVLWTEFFNNLDWPMTCAISIVMMSMVMFPSFLFGMIRKRI